MRIIGGLASLVVILGALVSLKSAATEVRSGVWEPAGFMTQARAGASAARLAEGGVLITGGIGIDGVLGTAELFSPGGSFSRVAPMINARSHHVSVTLEDGRVLVAGGRTHGDAVFSAAELYIPRADAWAPAGGMHAGRVGHTATLLSDGRVLVAGGQDGAVTHASLEIFDPATTQFETLPVQLSSPRARHAAARLLDGKILIVGGSNGTETLRSTDIFDPVTGTVSRGPDLMSPREDFTATPLLDGRVLIAGGTNGSLDLSSAEVFDPVTGTLSPTGPMSVARRGHLAFLLPNNNRVLFVGGDPAGNSAELFTPWRGVFQATGDLQEGRLDASGAPVGVDGAFLLVGGRNRSLRLDSSRLYRFPTIKTDQPQYSPGATVAITGSGWQPGEKVTLLLQEFPKTHEDRVLTAAADAAGNIFNNEYRRLDRDPAKKYLLTAYAARAEGQNGFVAKASADLDQCANGPLSAPMNTCDWVNGNLGGSKAHYAEGDSNAYRLRMTDLAPASSGNAVTIEWDTTQSGKHALDYITSFDRTVTGANPCLGVAGCGAASIFPIPADPNVAANILPGRQQISGVFTMYGGTVSTVSAYTLSGSYAGSSSTRITINFTANQSTVVLAWGGHIASRKDWGQLNAAVNISGSPWHMRLVDLNGSGGNQDRSLSSDAVIFPGSITIIKDATPNDAATSFSFTASPSPLTNFSVVDDGTSANTKVFSDITNFTTYTVSESSLPPGWVFDSFTCSLVGTGSVPSSGTSPSVSVNLKEGDDATCTFYNHRLKGVLTVVKHVINDNGGTASAADFTMKVSGVNPSATSFPGAELPGTTVTLDPGAYGVTETFPAGYTASYSTDCSGTIAAGEAKTCTVTNNDNAATLTLVKNLVKDSGGAAAATDWTLTATGPTTITGATASATVTNASVNTGTYALSESGPSGYTASAWSCTGAGGTLTGSQLVLTLGAAVTCTITNNDDPAHLTLVKTVTNNDGGSRSPAEWTLSASGPTPISGKTTEAGVTNATVNAGTYTLSESGPDDYTASAWSCTGGTQNGNQITLAVGQSATCTINNDDKPARLTLVKQVTNDNGGTALATAWTLRASGPVTISGASNSAGVTDAIVKAGAYTLSEFGGPAGYTAGSWTCVGGSLSGDQVSLALGQSVTCTITNNDDPPTLTIKKVCVPANDPGLFTMNVSGNGTNSNYGPVPCGSLASPGTTSAIPLKINVPYTVTEAPGLNTDLANYAPPTYGGDCSANGTVTLTTLGKSYTCYVLNERKECVAPPLPGATP